MFSNITLGQYIPGRSPLHRMDPRFKLGLTVAGIVLVFVANNFASLAVSAALVLTAAGISGISLRQYLKSLKGILVLILFTAALNLFYGSGETLWQWGFLRITTGGVSNAVFIAARIVCLILLSAALTYTTSPTQLTDALERAMKPLGVFHIRVHEIAMIMTIALRFVPTLLEETDKIMSAQKARGADLESGGVFQRIRALIPILIPLFVSAFRRAYDLATAMECRCYRGGEGRTKMKVLRAARGDYLALLAAAGFAAAVALCNIFLPFLR